MATLILMYGVTELWILENTEQFISGFIAVALLKLRELPDDYFFILECGSISVPVSRNYDKQYTMTANTLFFGGLTTKPLSELMKKNATDGRYVILISTEDNLDRDNIIALEGLDDDFIRGMLSAIDTYNLSYVLRYQIYKDGVFYDIPGRNLIQPE